MSKNITIAGLGWLGLPFSIHLLNRGYAVKGSVTTQQKAEDLRSKAIDAYRLEINEHRLQGSIKALLSEAEVLVIMIPPGLRRNQGANYALKMARFLQVIEQQSVKNVILVSSTSVYDDSQGTVTEDDIPLPQTLAGKQLLDVEKLFFNSPHFNCSVVRFGGLYGGNRNPVNFLAGRTDLRNGAAPVNLIHRDDCIGILTAIIEQEAYGHIFNAVMPQHPSKKEYYTSQAIQLGLEPPLYVNPTVSEVFKRVNSSRIPKVLGYTFQHALS